MKKNHVVKGTLIFMIVMIQADITINLVHNNNLRSISAIIKKRSIK